MRVHVCSTDSLFSLMGFRPANAASKIRAKSHDGQALTRRAGDCP